jgi:hypothetical protein
MAADQQTGHHAGVEFVLWIGGKEGKVWSCKEVGDIAGREAVKRHREPLAVTGLVLWIPALPHPPETSR